MMDVWNFALCLFGTDELLRLGSWSSHVQENFHLWSLLRTKASFSSYCMVRMSLLCCFFVGKLENEH